MTNERTINANYETGNSDKKKGKNGRKDKETSSREMANENEEHCKNTV